jgi:signal peptidase II
LPFNKKKILKKYSVVLLILAILIADQAIKIYIKTHFPYENPENEVKMVGNWARLHFVENSGMAWGMHIFGGQGGKLVLTIFRMLAAIFGVYYIGKILKQKMHKGFIICVALIFAGAVGNLIDSMFYGLFFDKGLHWDPSVKDYVGYTGIAKFGGGYASFLQGSVVDMFYFPLFDARWPSWLPFIGGDKFEFFSPVFNLADAAISIGVISILLFQNKFFHKKVEHQHPTVETNSTVNDSVQIL